MTTNAAPLFAAMSTTFNASTPTEAFVAGLCASKTLRERIVVALVAFCATMTGASRAAEIVTAFHIANEAEHDGDTLAKREGRTVEQKFNARSLYAEITRKADAAGHSFTIAQRSVKEDDGAKRLAWIGATQESVAAKRAAASGPRKPRAKVAGEMTDKQAIMQVRALLKLEESSNAQTVAAVAALLKRLPAAAPSVKRDVTTAGKPRAAVLKRVA